VSALIWSVRRELWEHRWLWSTPLIIAAVVVAVFSGVAFFQGTSHTTSGLFDLASRMILMTGTIVAFVYCAEALHGERRDRAILFWKTWPVGDTTAVAAKALVPVIILPAMTLAMLLVSQVIAHWIVMGKGFELKAPMASPFGAALEVFAAALWIAPVYAWIMVVSAWARRAVLLLAFIPMLLVAIIEAMITRQHTIGLALSYRGVGRHWPLKLNLNSVSPGAMTTTPASELLRSPALWLGVALALLLLALVTALRRRMIATN